MSENKNYKGSFEQFCTSLDLFSKPVRSFTINGSRDISTRESRIMTIIFTMSMLAMISTQVIDITMHHHYKFQTE